jgi:hypothetical protein
LKVRHPAHIVLATRVCDPRVAGQSRNYGAASMQPMAGNE